tara:strand:+ start:434 stop:742 length:309 start_codon:yes stop_codon:yes gene_type:complete
MKRAQWSEFEKFVVMADKHTTTNGYLKADYPAFLDYRVLKTVVENIKKGQQPDSYYHDGVYLNLGVTRGVVEKIFDKLEKGIWDVNCKIIASKLGLRYLRSR